MLYIALAAAAALIGIDQLTKIIVDSNMQLHDSIPLITIGDLHILNITYERNTGAAFSILEGKQMFLIIITAVVLAGMLFMLLTKRIEKKPYVWCVSLILAGGVGNLIDRVLRGFVVDFIDVKVIKFAVFNVADICATVGAALLILFVIIDEVKEHKARKNKAASADAGEAEENA